MNHTRTTQPAPEGLPLEDQTLTAGLDLVEAALEPAPTSQLATRTATAPATMNQAPTPMALLQIAMNQGADLDRLERLMVMQERWEANEARKAYLAAFAAFKAEAVTIVKTIKVADGPLKGKTYADLFAVVDAVTPALSKHGLSLSWKLTKDEKDWLEVTAMLRHELGHSETVSMGGPPDRGGAKNEIQARGSAKSYLERYTGLAITGMAASGVDTDGRPPQGKPEIVEMPEADFQRHLQRIREAKDDEALRTAYTAAADACHPQDKGTLDAFAKAKNERYRAMHPKAQPQGGAR